MNWLFHILVQLFLLELRQKIRHKHHLSSKQKLKWVQVIKGNWCEIDTPEDLKRAEKLFN